MDSAEIATILETLKNFYNKCTIYGKNYVHVSATESSYWLQYNFNVL